MAFRRWFPTQVQHGYKPAYIDGDRLIVDGTGVPFKSVTECQTECSSRVNQQIEAAKIKLKYAQAEMDEINAALEVVESN